MDMYARNPGREGSESDPPPTEWPPETSLEESMWRLGLGSRGESFPERVGVADCVYYMRTGICGFGSRCRFNHPRDRAAAAATARFVGGDYPERPGEPSCQYYLRTGACKFGVTCKFHHPRDAGGLLSNVSVNYHGYPLRPGEKECSYYLKTGQCKYGITCKFHHPEPAGGAIQTHAPPFYPTVPSPSAPVPEPMAGASASYRVARPPILPGSYVSGAYGPMLLSPGVMPVPGWTSYSGPASPALSPGAQPSGAAGSVYAVAQPSSSTPTVGSGAPVPSVQALPDQSGVKDMKFPERPGQPECQYYLKTGDCKFGLSCKFHHPPERAGSSATYYLSPMGLPLRPGAESCKFYVQNGYCKFGPTCKFDHPMDPQYSPSSSPVTEMPMVSYLTGSSLPNMPPSFSSSEHPPPDHDYELTTGPHSSRMPSSAGTSGSLGLTFSQTEPPITLSSVQQR